jgi:hypothetical protein
MRCAISRKESVLYQYQFLTVCSGFTLSNSVFMNSRPSPYLLTILISGELIYLLLANSYYSINKALFYNLIFKLI